MKSECTKQGIESAPHSILERLSFVRDALNDASNCVASPRLRVGAAYDVAVVAGLIVAELDGCPIQTWNVVSALAYLRERSSIRQGLSSHVHLLSRFDRGDYDRSWIEADAVRSFRSATRIWSALCWRRLGFIGV